jgi:excisionase family DNA binding protein
MNRQQRIEEAEKDWTTTRLSKVAGVSDAYIRQLLLSGKLEGYKLGRDWRIPDEVARPWLEDRGVEVE